VVVLDLNLPDGDGLSLCRDRARGYADAIIMVTARDSALDRVLGLELGADDYLTKPFEPRELLARVRNLIRRAPRRQAGARPRSARFARLGPWKLDLLLRRRATGGW
jgi:two-component system OmpR family response regulator